MDFIILKVNGTDVSSFPHEDAVRAFLSANEPIVVEVKRRITDGSCAGGGGGGGGVRTATATPRLVSTSVQTDITAFTWFEDNCFSNDIDLEEITLRKCSSDEKLGLTVCYSSGSEADTCTEVYIRNIEPKSVADRDGRLREGDQILQVNGKDVANKEETESLFAENRNAVTLLVSRYLTKNDSEFFETESKSDLLSPNARSVAYQNSAIEQIVQQQTELLHSPKSEIPPPRIPPHFIQDKLNLTNSLVRSKLDSINHEILELDHRMQNIQLINKDKRKPPQLPHVPAPVESDTEHIYETIPESVDSEIEPIYSCPYETGDDNLIEQWLKTQESSEWTPKAKEGSSKESKKEKSRSKSSKSNSSGEEHENSSSAYNTGGSCNSNPLTFELACSADSKQKDIYRSTFILCPPLEMDECKLKKEGNESQESNKSGSKPKKNPKMNNSKLNSPLSPTTRPGIAPMMSDTMYTNVANLQQTMLLQQQLFRQALGQNPEISTMPTPSFTAPSLSQYQFVSSSQQFQTTHKGSSTVDTRMEWKVKRRPDGSRYIARRPVRNRILKNRAIRITEERAGLTTEDDTISELKIGRYWSKEERKKHLEKSRERKQRQEILLASKNIDENMEIIHPKGLDKPHILLSKKVANNIDNTAKKHKIKKNHKECYENFSTVQDVIVHGPKVLPNQNSKMIGLLSVTTV